MAALDRSAYRRLCRDMGVAPGDRTFGGLLPEDACFEPQPGVMDVYESRTEIREPDLQVFDRGVDEADNMHVLSVSHLAAGVLAVGRGATQEIAFMQAMQVLRGRLVLARINRERERAKVVADRIEPAGDRR